jgi:RNA polymerase sigma-70 factor (ECF subfamily)
MWTRIRQAHGDDTELATDAVIDMVEQYSGAVYRYLLAILRDQNAADEVFQEFALRLVQGCFHRAAPERGRFRDYLKVSVSRLVTDYYRRRKSERRERAVAGVEAVEESPADMGAQFESSWREELLSYAWRKLQELEVTSGQPYHAVLNYRAQRPRQLRQKWRQISRRSSNPNIPLRTLAFERRYSARDINLPTSCSAK